MSTSQYPCKNCGFEEGAPKIYTDRPDLEYLLSSNIIPSDAEKNLTHEAIQEGEQELDFLDAKILKLTREIEQIRSRRQVVQTAVDNHKHIFSPVRRFPVEILSEIFIQAVPDIWIIYGHPLPAISRVCRLWRNVALTTQEIWSTLNIRAYPFAESKSPTNDSSQRLLQICINRSGNLPLRFVYATAFSGDNTQYYCDTLHMLVKQSHRWQHATFRFPFDNALQYFALVKNGWPILRTLTLVSSYKPNPQSYTINVFKNAPQLRSLSLEKFAYPADFKINWNQITHYRSSMNRRHDFNAIFPLMDNLAVLEENSDNFPQILNKHALNRLRMLSVGFQPSQLHLFLRHITAPNLDILSIRFHGNGIIRDSTNIIIISDFVHRSGCALSCIYLFGGSFLNIISLLEEIPGVASLTFDSIYTATVFITKFKKQVNGLTEHLSLWSDDTEIAKFISNAELISPSKPICSVVRFMLKRVRGGLDKGGVQILSDEYVSGEAEEVFESGKENGCGSR